MFSHTGGGLKWWRAMLRFVVVSLASNRENHTIFAAVGLKHI